MRCIMSRIGCSCVSRAVLVMKACSTMVCILSTSFRVAFTSWVRGTAQPPKTVSSPSQQTGVLRQQTPTMAEHIIFIVCLQPGVGAKQVVKYLRKHPMYIDRLISQPQHAAPEQSRHATPKE